MAQGRKRKHELTRKTFDEYANSLYKIYFNKLFEEFAKSTICRTMYVFKISINFNYDVRVVLVSILLTSITI